MTSGKWQKLFLNVRNLLTNPTSNEKQSATISHGKHHKLRKELK